MSNIEKIIELLKDKSPTAIINPYVSLLQSCKSGVITRRKELISTKACRLWQLQCCIFVIIYNINPTLIKNQQYLFELCELYYNIFSNKQFKLYNFIVENKLPDPPDSLRYVTDKARFKDHLETNPISYLCIYGIEKVTNGVYPNGVVHYFIIIKNDNDYYITSSYASDHVCIPYYIEKLVSIEEFYNFCDYLNQYKESLDRPTVYTDFITNFMRKYFLSNAVPKRYSADEIEYKPSLWFKYIPPGEGERREIKYILDNSEMYFGIAIITNYQEVVKSEIILDSDSQVKSESASKERELAGIIYTGVKYKKRKNKKSKKSKKNQKKSKKRKSKKIKKTEVKKN